MVVSFDFHIIQFLSVSNIAFFDILETSLYCLTHFMSQTTEDCFVKMGTFIVRWFNSPSEKEKKKLSFFNRRKIFPTSI